jgi:uncharacterized GH25 family protein
MNRYARFGSFALALLVPLQGYAHDFWIRPEKLSLAPNSAVKVDFEIGHDDIVEPWALSWERIVALRSEGPDGTQDHQAGIIPIAGATAGSALVRLKSEGTHVLAFESHHATSELPAEKFNAYLELEGLTPAIQARERAGDTDKPGRELYSRRAKAIIQVGERRTDTATQPVGHTLEIVPENNPHGAHGDDVTLTFRILFQGRPLPGALVNLDRLGSNNKTHSQEQRSDAEGRVRFALPVDGPWKANVIWTRVLTDRTKADFETLFSSLVFTG